jgi:mono/diheme cytochrome c family protein
MNPSLCFCFAVGFAVSASAQQPVRIRPVPAQPAPIHARTLSVPANVAPSSSQSLDHILAWDADTKDQTVTNGTPEAHFTFNLTNVSPETVTINNVFTSCGCTVAKLPEQPWKLAPGTNGQIHVTMNLANKFGTVRKRITVNSDKGVKYLDVLTKILPPPASEQMNSQNRAGNQKVAMADRQAVFRGDCARCHVEPTRQKYGLALYQTACGICHEAERRATMVPDLHALKENTNAEFWRNWITHGKAGTLMPAFSEKEGGILTDAQINSLVNYLSAVIRPRPVAKPAQASAKLN